MTSINGGARFGGLESSIGASLSMKQILKAAIWVSLTLMLFMDSVVKAYEICQTLNTEIVMTKEKTFDYNGRPMRLLCVGTINIRKCEGTCSSQVSPSVVKFPGFLKDCRCCRESSLQDRFVTLPECYDGSRLVIGEFINMYIKEPADCQCFDCAM